MLIFICAFDFVIKSEFFLCHLPGKAHKPSFYEKGLLVYLVVVCVGNTYIVGVIHDAVGHTFISTLLFYALVFFAITIIHFFASTIGAIYVTEIA